MSCSSPTTHLESSRATRQTPEPAKPRTYKASSVKPRARRVTGKQVYVSIPLNCFAKGRRAQGRSPPLPPPPLLAPQDTEMAANNNNVDADGDVTMTDAPDLDVDSDVEMLDVNEEGDVVMKSA
ncbi:MAG: hypothetical protein MMC33_006158 [Icmadophila ericetorum]|nr:hypothetical protein [Icmadophila ericetorum]